MAPRYRDPDDFDTPETDGGEARPRPLKSRRLVDMLESPSKGKGRETRESAASGRPERISSAPLASEPLSPRQARSAFTKPKTTPPKPSASTATAETATTAKTAETATTATTATTAVTATTATTATTAATAKTATTAETARKKPASSAPAKQSAPDLPPDTRAVLSVTPAGEGETVTVVLALPDPEGKKAQRVSFRLLVEQYAELGVKTGEITPEYAETLLDAGELCDAIRRGISMLGYGDQSARRLAYKLTAKGVDRYTATRAVTYLTERGYIREESTATLRARQGVSKGWGERRIREDLMAHGFTREAVEEAMEDISDTDWEENCAAAIRKKYGEIPEDRGERQKLIAAMMRLGYDADTVREAMRVILRES